MIAGNYGQLDRVLMTDKERLLFLAITFSGEANLLYAYELSSGKDYGQIMVARLSNFHALGSNKLMWNQTHPKNPALSGWYLTDSLFEEIKERKATEGDSAGLYPGEVPLTKALTDKKVEGVADMFQKQLHQGKRLLYAYTTIPGTHITQRVMVNWSEDLQEVDIEPLLLQKLNTDVMFNEGPSHISGDGNWMTGIRSYLGERGGWSGYGVVKDELVVYHLQDHYPQGMNMPISLGYTDKGAGAFLNHTTLGPLYIEKPYTDTLFIYKLNDGLEILKEQEINAKNMKKKALLEAAISGNTKIVLSLINDGTDINIKDNDGKTALLWASVRGDTEIALSLINAGADVNIQTTKHGETALYWASYFGRTEIVKSLIEASADLNIKYHAGETALYESSRQGHTEIVKSLIEAGCDINIESDSGKTALIVASGNGHTEIVKLLIATGIDVNIHGKYGSYALGSASYYERADIVKLLKEAGAKY